MSKHNNSLAGALFVAVFAASCAHAGMVSDVHGNVGYDTAAECDAAVAAGTAKFYTVYTRKPTLLRAGEVSVQTMTLKDLSIPQNVVQSMSYQANDYKRGACDLGAARRAGRDGVAKPLQGKYVPFSSDMQVNVYMNKSGQAVRVTMKECDNWFGSSFPRPIPALPVSMKPETQPIPAVNPPAPQVLAPTPSVEAPLAPASIISAVQLARGVIGLNQFIGLAGVLTVGAVLFNGGDTGTSGTSGTSGTTGTTGTF